MPEKSRGLPRRSSDPCAEFEGKSCAGIGFRPTEEKARSAVTSPLGDAARCFMNITYNEPGRERLLAFSIDNNQPQAELTHFAMKRCEEWRQTAKKRYKKA